MSDCFDIDELEDQKGYNKLVYLYPVLENDVYLRMKGICLKHSVHKNDEKLG